ncbi:MAG: hypothetical protein ACLF0P_04570 [Thermoanaerobaculia bacterium]
MTLRIPRPRAMVTPWAMVVSMALLLAGCGGGGGDGSPTAPPNPDPGPGAATVEVHDSFFEPRSVTIEPGTTVRWVRRGQLSNHTVTARDGSFDSGFAFGQSGATFEHTFGAETDGRTFEYSCVTHEACCDMKGSVRVGQDAPAPDPGYG